MSDTYDDDDFTDYSWTKKEEEEYFWWNLQAMLNDASKRRLQKHGSSDCDVPFAGPSRNQGTE